MTKYEKQGYKRSVLIFPLQFFAFQAFSALQPKHSKKNLKNLCKKTAEALTNTKKTIK